MTLTFQWEPLRLLLDEPNVGDLLRSHWEEVEPHKAEMPLDPDYQRFIDMDDAGLFRVWTARDGGTLAGYIGFFIQPHLHYRSTLTATEDLCMLSPPYRRGLAGVRLLTTAIDALRQMGVKRVFLGSKPWFEAERGGLGKIYRRLGFENTDLIWSRML